MVSKAALSGQDVDDIRNELRISTRVGSHQHIVFLKEFVETEKDFCFVMDLCTGGDLFDHVLNQPNQSFTEAAAARLTVQMLAATAYLHSINIVHRDLKPVRACVRACV